MKTLLIICCFNENIKIQETARRVREAIDSMKPARLVDFLLVDDGSTDGATKEAALLSNAFYIRNEEQKGVGFSLRVAYSFGLSKGYDILVTMAGNNKDEPRELPLLFEPIEKGEADLVQGSRYFRGGHYGAMPAYRFFATRYLHPWIFSMVSGKKMTDTTNGFRAIHASILRDSRINFDRDEFDHYELEPYLLCSAVQLGYRVTEVPVTKIYPPKKLSYSKMVPFIDWWRITKPLIRVYFKERK